MFLYFFVNIISFQRQNSFSLSKKSSSGLFLQVPKKNADAFFVSGKRPRRFISRSPTLRAAPSRDFCGLLRKSSESHAPDSEGGLLACASPPPPWRDHYCNTQHLHLGFFFRVTCSTCDASPGPCAVILATSTVAVLAAPTYSIDKHIFYKLL